MSYIPGIGHTLFIPSGPFGDHLFVVLTGISSTLTHLLANFSSIKEDVPHDMACLIPAGAHGFITVPSFIEYQFARIEMASDLSARVDSGKFKLGDPVTPELLERIRAGLPISRKCAPKYKSYLERYKDNP